jgi:hypothetical protein
MEPAIATLGLEITHGQNPRIRAFCLTKSGKLLDLTEYSPLVRTARISGRFALAKEGLK